MANIVNVMLLNPSWRISGGEVAGGFEIVNVNSYSHEINIDGGYRSASFAFNATLDDARHWMKQGLGWDVVVTSDEGVTVWNGFVNQITLNIGGTSISRGPLLDLANRVAVAYTPYVDITVSPPQTGEPTTTVFGEDLVSQSRYGVFEFIVSGGTLIDNSTYIGGSTPPDHASMIRDAYIADYRSPAVTYNINTSASGEPIVISMECRGYVEFMNKYIYLDSNTGYVTAPQKIISVLQASPNNVFSQDITGISQKAQHLFIVRREETQYRTAKSIIDEIVSLGDASGGATYFMILDRRRAYYDSVPSEVSYVVDLTASDGWITTAGGQLVEPMSIVPGRRIKISGLIAAAASGDLDDDPTVSLITAVRYTMPNQVEISGSRLDKVSRLIARAGIAIGG